MGSGFSKKKKQAKAMQEQMFAMQEKLKEQTATGTSAGGLVEVTLSGDNEMKSVNIKPECVDPDDLEALQDLFISAYEDARKKLESQTPQIPGFPGLF